MIGLSMAHATSTIPAVETWRPVKGYEGLYEVSDLARVRSLDRMTKRKKKDGTFGLTPVRGHIMKQSERNGYLFVNLSEGHRKVKSIDIHRIVATAFVPNPNDLTEINHKDENKHNNLPSNLEWCNHQYNTNYGTGKWRKAVPRRKKVEQLTLDGRHVAYYESVCKLSRIKGYSQGNISTVCRGEKPTAYGYQWRYV